MFFDVSTVESASKNNETKLRLYVKTILSSQQQSSVATTGKYMPGALRANNIPDMLAYIRTSAENQNPTALYCMGFLHEKGLHVEQDQNQSDLFYEQSARSGYLRGMYKFYCILEKKGDSHAVDWLNRATEHPEALYRRALDLKSKKDYINAIDFFERAVAQEYKDKAKSIIEEDYFFETVWAFNDFYRYLELELPNFYKAIVNELETIQEKTPECLNLLGELYMQGNGVDQNDEKCFLLFSKAKELRCAAAINNLGILFRDGRVKKDRDLVKAIAHFREAIAIDPLFLGAKYNLAKLLWKGPSYMRNLLEDEDDIEELENVGALNVEEENWLSLMHEAAQAGYAPAIHSLAWAMFYGNAISSDLKKAEELFQQATLMGYSLSWTYLGNIYHNRGSKAKGRSLFEIAAEKFEMDGFLALATLYQKGDGVEKNIDKAAQNYQAVLSRCGQLANFFDASLVNSVKAYLGLGYCYLSGGNDIDRDQGLAFRSFKSADELCKGHERRVGNLFAMSKLRLGLCHFYGDGTPENKEAAFSIFKSVGPDDSNADLHFERAKCYYLGNGTNKNVGKAVEEFVSCLIKLGKKWCKPIRPTDEQWKPKPVKYVESIPELLDHSLLKNALSQFYFNIARKQGDRNIVRYLNEMARSLQPSEKGMALC